MNRTWTPKQARYTGPIVTGDSRNDGTGIPLHFQLTVHGGICRTWVGPDLTEVLLLRHGNLRPTYQGTVRATGTGWAGYTPTGEQLTPEFADYLAAEAPLLPRRTRHRSITTYTWPTEIRRSIR